MPVKEKTGEMGWWINPKDSIHYTFFQDQLAIEKLENQAPKRFTCQAAKPPDPETLKRCKQYGKDNHGIDKGWSSQWLEDLCAVDLDQTPAQIIGSCVATSHIMLVATRALHEVVLLGEQESLLGEVLTGEGSIMPFGPYSYRVGRAAAGINGGGDGSTCGGQIKGTMNHGFLPCDSGVESDFYPEPKSTRLYRQWGANNSKASEWYSAAEKFDLTESERVRDTDALWDRIVNQFKFIQICSGWGFGPTSKKLRNGWTVYRRSGSWSHSMQIIAAFEMDGDRYYIVRNQWGRNAHRDGNWFVVDESVMRSWLRSAVAMTIGNLKQRDSGKLSIFPI